MSFEYLLTAFIVCLAPGIGVVYTLLATLGGGFRAGFWASVGCTIATIFHMIVAMAGLAAVLHSSAVLFQFTKFAGVAYLLWMAWAVLKDRGGMSVAPSAPATAGRIVWRGILLNLLNPKLPLFFMAFLPQFTRSEYGPVGLQILALGLMFVCSGTLVTAAYGMVAGLAGKAMARRMRVVNRLASVLFAGLALRLVWK